MAGVEDESKPLWDAISALETELGLEPGFLDAVRREDDWSFVIKTHALIEASLSHLLMHALDRAALETPLSRLNYRVKMQFVEALGLLADRDCRFLFAINDLRNKIVHDVRNVRFDLRAHFASLDRESLQREAEKFNSFSSDDHELEVPDGGDRVSIPSLFASIPKRAIWWSAMNTLGIIYENKAMASLRHRATRDKAYGWDALVSMAAQLQSSTRQGPASDQPTHGATPPDTGKTGNGDSRD